MIFQTSHTLNLQFNWKYINMPCFNFLKNACLCFHHTNVLLIIQNFKNYNALMRCKLKFVAMDIILQLLRCFHGIFALFRIFYLFCLYWPWTNCTRSNNENNVFHSNENISFSQLQKTLPRWWWQHYTHELSANWEEKIFLMSSFYSHERQKNSHFSFCHYLRHW